MKHKFALPLLLCWLFSIAPPATVAEESSPRLAQQSNSAANCGMSRTPATALDYLVLGRLCKSQGLLEQAIAAYRQAIQLNPNLAIAYNNLGVVLAERGLLDQAIESYRHAIDRDPNLGDAYANWAEALRQQGRTAEAVQQDQQAAEAFRRTAEIPNSGGAAFIVLGNEFNRQSRLEEAIEAYRLAIQISPNLIAAYNNLGNTLISQGRGQFNRLEAENPVEAQRLYHAALEEAVTAYQSATQVMLPANPPTNFRVALTRAYDGLGFAFSELGQTEAATQAYDQALRTDPRLSMFPDPTDLESATEATAEDFNYLGRVLRSQRRTEQALAAYRRAIAIDPNFAAAYNNMGVILADQGQLAEAIDNYRKATELDPTPIQFVNLGNALFRARRVDEALQAYQGIDAVLDRIEKLPARVENLDLLDTLISGQRNFDWYQSRAQFFAQNQDYYASYITLLMDLHKRYPGRGLDAKALEVSERARARGLLETLVEANVCQTVSNDRLANLIQEECRLQRDFKQQIEGWNRLNARQTIPTLPASGEATLSVTEHSATEQSSSPAISPMQATVENEQLAVEQRIRELLQEYETLQAQIREVSESYAQLAQPSRLNVQEIQSQIIDNQTLLLQYWLGEQASYLWVVSKPGVISPSGVASYVLPDRATINQAAREFYDYLTNPSQRVKTVRTAQSGMRLSQMILGDIADQLGDRRLLIIADGMLRYIPFSALPDPNADARLVDRTDIANIDLDDLPDPLLVNHEIVNAPSASILAAISQRATTRRPPAQTLAVLADPVFNTEDDRFRQSATSDTVSSSSANQSDSTTPSSAEVLPPLTTVQEARPLIRGNLSFPRLAGTNREADRILEIAKREGFEETSSSFLGFAVNRETLSTLNQYRLIHVATHGVLDDLNPGQSGLMLSQFNGERTPVQNGFLNMSDIFNLDFSADLVVLSSCRTGLGTEVTGEGLVGVAQGFLRAGASSVVVSLWSVHDEATSVLMEQFYKEMLDNINDRDRPSPAQALRAAQLQLWNSRRWKTPYYWAAFTVQGEW